LIAPHLRRARVARSSVRDPQQQAFHAGLLVIAAAAVAAPALYAAASLDVKDVLLQRRIDDNWWLELDMR
jgi:choline dehydrogenase-like flavoprotein